MGSESRGPGPATTNGFSWDNLRFIIVWGATAGGGHDFMDYKFVGSLDFIRFKIQPNNINL